MSVIVPLKKWLVKEILSAGQPTEMGPPMKAAEDIGDLSAGSCRGSARR